MSSKPNAAQPKASPSTSSPPSVTIPSMQSHERANTPSRASNTPSALPSDDDDELSDVPETPIFPASPPPQNLHPNAPPPDSDSDLSDAPSSPVWPEDPKAPPPPPRCTEKDCPVRQAIGRHNQGTYLHTGKPPLTNGTVFGSSNPPPHVWESWVKIQARDPSSTVEDDWNVLGFLRWHVDDPNTSLMGV